MLVMRKTWPKNKPAVNSSVRYFWKGLELPLGLALPVLSSSAGVPRGILMTRLLTTQFSSGEASKTKKVRESELVLLSNQFQCFFFSHPHFSHPHPFSRLKDLRKSSLFSHAFCLSNSCMTGVV